MESAQIEVVFSLTKVAIFSCEVLLQNASYTIYTTDSALPLEWAPWEDKILWYFGSVYPKEEIEWSFIEEKTTHFVAAFAEIRGFSYGVSWVLPQNFSFTAVHYSRSWGLHRCAPRIIRKYQLEPMCCVLNNERIRIIPCASMCSDIVAAIDSSWLLAWTWKSNEVSSVEGASLALSTSVGCDASQHFY